MLKWLTPRLYVVRKIKWLINGLFSSKERALCVHLVLCVLIGRNNNVSKIMELNLLFCVTWSFLPVPVPVLYSCRIELVFEFLHHNVDDASFRCHVYLSVQRSPFCFDYVSVSHTSFKRSSEAKVENTGQTPWGFVRPTNVKRGEIINHSNQLPRAT